MAKTKTDEYIATVKLAIAQYKKGEISRKRLDEIRDEVSRNYLKDQEDELINEANSLESDNFGAVLRILLD
ncbi:MAG: hypothetical protein AAF717_00125 [Bacteroidota bacterium]